MATTTDDGLRVLDASQPRLLRAINAVFPRLAGGWDAPKFRFPFLIRCQAPSRCRRDCEHGRGGAATFEDFMQQRATESPERFLNEASASCGSVPSCTATAD